MDRFRTMETFVRVARAGSFTVAANQLGLSRALVSRHVGMLEERLGVRLLHRTTRSLNLTDEGRSYLAFCEQIVPRHRRAGAGAGRDAARSLPAPCGLRRRNRSARCIWRMRSLPSRGSQPKLHVQLILENVSFQPTDFGKRGFDLVLQFSPARNASLVETPIAAMDWVVCAAPSLLIREGRPTAPADLARFPCLLHETALPNDRLWRFEGPRGALTVKVTGSFSSNSALALRKAVIAGLGAASAAALCGRRRHRVRKSGAAVSAPSGGGASADRGLSAGAGNAAQGEGLHRIPDRVDHRRAAAISTRRGCRRSHRALAL